MIYKLNTVAKPYMYLIECQTKSSQYEIIYTLTSTDNKHIPINSYL